MGLLQLGFNSCWLELNQCDSWEHCKSLQTVRSGRKGNLKETAHRSLLVLLVTVCQEKDLRWESLSVSQQGVFSALTPGLPGGLPALVPSSLLTLPLGDAAEVMPAPVRGRCHRLCMGWKAQA